MKKYYFMMAAVSAIMLTACSSEDDVLQTGPQKVVENSAVGFEIYTPAATQTRSGMEGTMTTGRLQRSEQYGGGFGVYAYLVEDEEGSEGDKAANATDYVTWMSRTTPAQVPNFMVNEKLLWNSVNQGWYYNPLKYWPNETDYDSQSSPAYMESDKKSTGESPAYNDMHLDRLTFFAYAPYVKTTNAAGPGITHITSKLGKLATDADGSATLDAIIREPSIRYKAALTNPNQAVDLLWGVAPAGGLTYTAVNGRTVTVKEGEPLIDMTKPDVNTNMKFLFQHALARIGVKAVAAIDQIGAGGKLDPNTKITIKEITLTGYFGEVGILNLDNPNANVANWVNIGPSDGAVNLAADTKLVNLKKTTLTLNVTSNTIAEHLRFVGDHTSPSAQANRIGVTTVKQDVIEPSMTGDKTHDTNGPWITSKTYADGKLEYSETTPYYTTTDCSTPATTEALGAAASGNHLCTISQKGVYTIADATGKDVTYKYPNVMNYYEVTFHKIDGDAASYATSTAYTLNEVGTANGAINDGETLTPKADLPANGDYVITASKLKVPYYDGTTYYKRDANYFMVVPTNNIEKICTTGITTPADKEALRTVRVKIEYYITTEDDALNAKRAQTKNVIEKDVVFPSIANGKSYNLNLILGLTSVKMEAEVDDWKVINVQADLPQNTAE